MRTDILAHLLEFSSNSTAVAKIRAYLNKWRRLRQGIPAIVNELSAIGMPPGPKFNAVVDQVFAMQMTGRGKTQEEGVKILRKLSGIKEPPKPKETKGKEKKHAGKIVGKAAPIPAGKAAAPPPKIAAGPRQRPKAAGPAKVQKKKRK